MCVTLIVLTTTYKTLKINDADVDCILPNILGYHYLVINTNHANSAGHDNREVHFMM